MAQMYTDAFLQAAKQSLEGMAQVWGLSPTTVISLLNISENATFRADDAVTGKQLVLRVHRPDYHTYAEISSELAWIEALRLEAIAPIPKPCEMTEGGLIATANIAGQDRDVVAFELMAGEEPSPSADLTGSFKLLGAISAKLHAHARGWRRPKEFVRKTWSYDTTIGPAAYWGDWRAALGLTSAGAAVLEQTCTLLQSRLSAFSTGPDRFGLIHADLRLANLLIDGDRIGLIDFDDCGFGWFAFDFAAAVSFFETDPAIPALKDAWCEGYRCVEQLPVEVEAELPTFIMLRRLQLTAWIASHSETPTAMELGASFTDGTIELAEVYLSRH
ncbi:MAG: phosphotransferase [Pseudomonadota bacterium]